MKATLEFDLNDHYDKLSHRRALAGTDAYLAFNDIDSKLRAMTKHGVGTGAGKVVNLPTGPHVITEHEAELLYEIVMGIRAKFNQTLEYYSINMGDLE